MSTEETPESPADDETTASRRGESTATALQRQHLLVFSDASSWMFQLPSEGRVVIGRSEAADLQIEHAAVWRQHAELRGSPGDISVVDLGSQKGTLVNGARIAGPTALAPGDTITIHEATLILHTTRPPRPPSVVVEPAVFRER